MCNLLILAAVAVGIAFYANKNGMLSEKGKAMTDSVISKIKALKDKFTKSA